MIFNFKHISLKRGCVHFSPFFSFLITEMQTQCREVEEPYGVGERSQAEGVVDLRIMG